MKRKFYLSAVCTCLFGFLLSASLGAQGWKITSPLVSGTSNTGKSILQAQDGMIVVLADTMVASVNYPLLFKLDQGGHRLWTKVGTTPDWDNASLVELADGRLVITGDAAIGFGLPAFAWQILDAQGNSLSLGTYNDGTQQFRCLHALPAPDGGFLLTGYTFQNTNVNTSGILVKVAANGSFSWSYPVMGDYAIADAAFFSNGDIAVCLFDWANTSTQLFSLDPVDFSTSPPVVFPNIRAVDLDMAASGGLFMLACTDPASGCDYMSTFGLNASFGLLWQSVFGELAHTLTPTADGGCTVTGHANFNFVVQKLNALGSESWWNVYFPFNAVGEAIAEQADGSLAAVGTVENGSHIGILKTDAQGNLYSHLVTGRIMVDANANCSFDNPGDQPPNAWTLSFVGDQTFTTTTNPSTGTFSILLDTGTYAVTVLPLTTQVQFQACQPLPTLQLSSFFDTTDLGLLLYKPQPNATLSGQVYFDLAQNAQLDPGDPTMACVDLHVTCNFPYLDTIVSTDADGFYSLGISKFASYTVTELTVFPNCISSQNFFPIYADSTVEVQNVGLGCWDFGYLPGIVRGHVDFDLDGDCLPDTSGIGANWFVAFQIPGASGAALHAFPDADGNYATGLPPGDYDISVMTPAGSWEVCNGFQSLTVEEHECFTADLVVHLPNCPQPVVDVAVNAFRPCQASLVQVQYCNNGTDPAFDAQVWIVLDPQLSFFTATLPVAAQSGDTLWFDLGDLDPLECGNFQVSALLSCDAIVGQTHCVEAHIFPDTLCSQPGSNWDGTNIELAARCENGSAVFTIANTGLGDMADPLPFVVIEDNVLLRPDELLLFQLPAGQDTSFSLEPLGAMLRLEVPQAPGHPHGSLSAVWLEGCGANPPGSFHQGFVVQHPLADEEPFLSVFCDESVGSYDPNIKKSFPKGIGQQHYIENTTDLDYQILFQNTGTAEAFKVVLRDTLSPFLDPASLHPGAASHPYSFSLENGHVAVFTFDDIHLPDSSSNAEGSVGFLSFRIAQAAGNPPGTLIENDAAIYFDFNAPVITPTVFHRIPLPVYEQTTELSLCFGENWNGTPFTADAVVADTVHFPFFDSIFITQIAVLPAVEGSISATICDGESYAFGGASYTQAGIYTQVFEAQNGCDSTATLSLDVLPDAVSSFSQTLCFGGSFTLNGTVFNELNPSGTVVFPNGSQFGCDSLVQVQLFFDTVATGTLAVALCPGGSIVVNGTVYNAANPTGEELLPDASLLGCDSLVLVSVELLEAPVTELVAAICEGDSFPFGNESLTDPGNYVHLFAAENGCDSTVNLLLTVLPNSFTTLDTSLLPGQSYHGIPVWADTLLTETYAAANGCDSTVQITIDVETTGLSHRDKKLKIKAFPNPFREDLVLQIETSAPSRWTVQVCNAQGMPVPMAIEQSGSYPDPYMLLLHGAALPPGIYWGRIVSEEFGVQLIKLVKA